MTELPSARQNALDRFDRYERRYYLFAVMLTAIELIFIWGFAQLADFTNRVHVLIFWSLLAIDGLVVMGVGLLWAHVSRCTRLVLKAIDLSAKKVPVEAARTPGPLGLEPDR
ncbi:MAG TPA: hypothetical protein VMH80_18200 [Bryobacteraceae bacterium]|nr:hypothetical protein [Bryobacteraceae bacterium]